MVVVIVLGLIAALLFSTAGLVQQQGILSALDTSAPVNILRGLGDLVRHRVWLLGWMINLTGFLCQAAALHLGSVAAVQPLLTTQLLFTLIVVSWHRRTPPRPLAWIGGAFICAGLVLLVTIDGATPFTGPPDRFKVFVATLVTAGLVTVLLRIASTRKRSRGVLLTATAAGLCYAMTAVFLKLSTDDLLTKGVSGALLDWPMYLLATSTASGLVIGQTAFASGPLTSSVAAMNITNPVASYLVGILAFRVAVPTTVGTLTAIACAGALLVLGITAMASVPGLARSHGFEVRAGDDPDADLVAAPPRCARRSH
ncbi:MAG: DMT family transporter [Nocardioidaceae bacterium]